MRARGGKEVNMAISCRKAFRVCEKFEFACAYCGDRPGRSHLEIDHLIPRSKGGSDGEENLVPACKPCNQGKSDSFYVPPAYRLKTDDEGLHVIAGKGVWCIKIGAIGAYVSGAVYGSNRIEVSSDCYEFEIQRCWGGYWVDHVEGKTWGRPHSMADFMSVLSLSRRMIVAPDVVCGTDTHRLQQGPVAIA